MGTSRGHGRRWFARSSTDAPDAVIVTPSESGLLVAGDRAAVDRYVDSLTSIDGAPAQLRRAGADAPSVTPALGALQATAGDYVQCSRDALALLRDHGLVPATDAGPSRAAVPATDRSVGSPLEWAAVSVGPAQALALQQAATMMALRAAIAEVTEAVERVEGKLDVLADLVRSERIGRAIADHRRLGRLVDRLDHGESLGDTDWTTVAYLGAEIGRDIESLRAFVRLRVGSIGDVPSWRHGARAERLESLIAAKLPDVLGLLVVCEHNLAAWQRCRLDRIGNLEPRRLASAVEEARTEIEAQRVEDQRLLDELTAVVSVLAEIGGFEGLNPMTARKLTSVTAELNESLDWFAAQRTLDHDWMPGQAPRLRESLGKLVAMSADAARSATRRVTGRGQADAGAGTLEDPRGE